MTMKATVARMKELGGTVWVEEDGTLFVTFPKPITGIHVIRK